MMYFQVYLKPFGILQGNASPLPSSGYPIISLAFFSFY